MAVPADTFILDYSPWVPDFIEELTRPLTAEEAADGVYAPEAPPRIAMTGTYDEMMDYFEGELVAHYSGGPWAWMSDGSPIVPPTEDRVAKMLTGTSHSPDEVFEFGRGGKYTATIEKIAVNAVMAGCKPEYMPVVLTIAENGDVGNYVGDSSEGWIFVVSGPIAKEIGMNFGFNVLNKGNPANTTLERFALMMGINLSGVTYGLNFIERVGTPFYGTIIAESPNTPWETLRENYGYDYDESILFQMRDHLSLIPFQSIEVKNPENLDDVMTGSPEFAAEAFKIGGKEARTLLLTPDTARIWKEKYGMDTMQELQEYFVENVTKVQGDLDRNYWRIRDKPASYEPPPYDDTLVPFTDDPQAFTIIVAGGTGTAWTWGVGGCHPMPLRSYSIDAWR